MSFFVFLKAYKRVLISHFITDSSAKLNRNPNSVPENIGDLLSDSASSAKVFLVYFLFFKDYLQHFVFID